MPSLQSKLKKKPSSRKPFTNNGSRRSLLILIILGVGLLLTVLAANHVQNIRQFASENEEMQETSVRHGDSAEDLGGGTELPKLLVSKQQSRSLCMGSGSDGPRVQVIYVYAQDQQNQLNELLPYIRGAASEASSAFDQSAMKTGGRRVVRYVTTADCQIDVKVVHLPMDKSDLDNFDMVKEYMTKQKYISTNRNIVVFTDTIQTTWCGLADRETDTSPGWKNRGNKGGNMAMLKRNCWTRVGGAHEIMHMLGAVSTISPNTNGQGHCVDDYDILCVREGDIKTKIVCPDYSNEQLLDCNNDDYYSFTPSGYLATHWNSAYSVFLDDPTRDAVVSVGSGGKDGITGNEKVSFSLAGFQPSEKVVILWNDSNVLKDVTVDGNGALQGTITTPNANQGQYRLVFRGSQGTYAEIGITVRKEGKKEDKKKNNNNNNSKNKNNNKNNNGKKK